MPADKDAMTRHARMQLAAALDAAGAWDAPSLCGKAVADLIGQHLPADGERRALAGMISDVLALVRQR